MSGPISSGLQQRVVAAASAVLARSGSVGPLELFQEMGWLDPARVEGWRQGREHYQALEPWIQVGAGKAFVTRAIRRAHTIGRWQVLDHGA